MGVEQMLTMENRLENAREKQRLPEEDPFLKGVEMKNERKSEIDRFKDKVDDFERQLTMISGEPDKAKQIRDLALLYVGIDNHQKKINNIAFKEPKVYSGNGEVLDEKCDELKGKIIDLCGDKQKFNEIVTNLFSNMDNKEFLKQFSKSERLDKITKPPKEAKDVKSGDDIRFTFTFQNKLNENLYLKTTAGQVLPSEVKEVECEGEKYFRDGIEGEFFTLSNQRLIIRESTLIKIGNTRNSEEITKLTKENELKVAEYMKLNPNVDQRIVSEAINRGIDPKFAVLTFSDLIKGETDQNKVDLVLEDLFTEFDRTRGNYNMSKIALDSSNNLNNAEHSESLIVLLIKFLGGSWKNKAKEYGITEENIKLAESSGVGNMSMDSEDIENSDNLQEGGYLKGEKLLNNPEFSKKLDSVCLSIGAKREDLIKVMYAESRLDPRIVNPISSATGLIQFMPKTARGLGTTIGKIRAMSGVDQLDYVEKYFKQNSGGHKLNSIVDLYKVVFYPASLGKGSDYVFGSQKGNADLVKSQNGIIAKFSTRADGLIDGYAFEKYVNNHVSKFNNIS